MQSKFLVIAGVLVVGVGLPLSLFLFSNAGGSGGVEEEPFKGPFLDLMHGEKLRLEFKTATEKANRAYTGKGVDILDMVVRMDKVTYEGVTYDGVQLTEEGSVHCAFPSTTKAQLSPVRPGQPLRVKGVCRGMVNGKIIVTGCHVPTEQLDDIE